MLVLYDNSVLLQPNHHFLYLLSEYTLLLLAKFFWTFFRFNSRTSISISESSLVVESEDSDYSSRRETLVLNCFLLGRKIFKSSVEFVPSDWLVSSLKSLKGLSLEWSQSLSQVQVVQTQKVYLLISLTDLCLAIFLSLITTS
jgi:hypothetical protein